jgi:hypothetical protein
MSTLEQVIADARQLYGPTPATFDYAYGLGDQFAEGALENAVWIAAGADTDPDRQAVEQRAAQFLSELAPELATFRQQCRDRKYVGWSRWTTGPIRYAEEAEATRGERRVQVAQVTDPPDVD